MKSSPTTGTPSGASISSASTTSDLQQHAALGQGLLNQFGALVPRHALFSVNVEIDQLSNVPLISGEFAVRWKFKNAQTRSGLLSRMRGKESWTSRAHGATTKGRGRASELGLAIEVTPADDDEEDGNESSPQDEGTEDEMYLRASGSSLDLTAMPPYTPDTAMPPSATPATATPGDIHAATSSTTTAVARGITPWQPLQNYNVKWDHQANVVLQMDVHRETGDLMPNEVKFVVMQVRGDVSQFCLER